MLRVRIQSNVVSVLDIDIENRPLSYMGGGFTSAEITAIAWSWVGSDDVHSFLLRHDGYFDFSGPPSGGFAVTAKDAFTYIQGALSRAGIVTGHYLRKHDLPMLNGTMLENGLPPLTEMLVQDTHGDLKRRKDLSASQESLAAMYRLPEAKHHMSQAEWREANRLTPDGLKFTRKRVVDDVLQHKALRKRLLEMGALREPKWWRP